MFKVIWCDCDQCASDNVECIVKGKDGEAFCRACTKKIIAHWTAKGTAVPPEDLWAALKFVSGSCPCHP